MTLRSCILVFSFSLASLGVSAQFKLYEKGHDLYTAGKYEDAIANFSEYLTKPTRDKALDVEVFYLRALSYYKSNNFKKAIGDFQETILLDHKNKGNIYWFLAKCHEKNNSLEECVNAYNYALRELNANKASKEKLLFERSQIHTKMNNLPMAYLDLKTLVAMQPTNTDAKRELEKLENQGIKPPANGTTTVLASATAPAGTTPANTTPPNTRNTGPDKKKDERVAKNIEPLKKEDKAAVRPDDKDDRCEYPARCNCAGNRHADACRVLQGREALCAGDRQCKLPQGGWFIEEPCERCDRLCQRTPGLKL